jgi:ABC-type Co2+ transport system permease subunit
MTIVNRRNAVLGWAVWQVAKRTGKQKARQAVPGRGDYAGLNKSAVATIGAAAAGTALVVLKKKTGEPTTE